MKRIQPSKPSIDPSKVYHVSNSRNRESIAVHGLVPGGDMEKTPEGTPKQHGDMNWVFKTPDAAQTASGGNWGPGKVDVWEIDHPHSDLHPDPHPGWESQEHLQSQRAVIKGRVDPARMRIYNDRRAVQENQATPE